MLSKSESIFCLAESLFRRTDRTVRLLRSNLPMVMSTMESIAGRNVRSMLANENASF